MKLRFNVLLAVMLLASCNRGAEEFSKSRPADSPQAPLSDKASPTSEADLNAVRDFVEAFYNWYVPVAAGRGTRRPSDLALEDRPSIFDPSLAAQLREDSAAQAKVSDDIVGLDFDPFLFAQDPCARYEIVNGHRNAENYLIDVRGVGGCEKHDQTDVIAEVASRNGALLFVNFHYPGPDESDLMTLLKKLKADRK